jgi:cytochrome c oxidase subunit IV
MGREHSHDIEKWVRVYIFVFVALMFLTIVTVAIAYLELQSPMDLMLALFIATIKGALVAAYFMHLINEKLLIYSILILTTIFFMALMILPSLWELNIVR